MSTPAENLENRSKPQFHRCHPGPYCMTYNCHRPAKWALGRPDGPITVRSKAYFCDDCARAIVDLLPDELIPAENELDPEEIEGEEAVAPVVKHRPKPLQHPKVRRS